MSDEQRIELGEAAGQMALLAGRYEAAVELLEEAAAGHAAAGRERDAARLAESIGMALVRSGRLEDSIERVAAALATLGEDSLDPVATVLNAVLGSALSFTGRHEEAAKYLEPALISAQALELPLPLCRALNARAITYQHQSRFDEAVGMWEVVVGIAERHGLTELHANALSNIGNVGVARDLPDAAERLEAAVAESSRIGDSWGRMVGTGNLMLSHLFTGRWDELERLGEELLANSTDVTEDPHVRLACLKAWRGEPAAPNLDALSAWRTGDNLETRFIALAADGAVALAERRYDVLLAGGTAPLKEAFETLGPLNESLRFLWPDTVAAALAAGCLDIASDLVELLAREPRGRVSPYLRAELHRARGLLHAARGEHEHVEAELSAAVDDLKALGYPYPLARVQIDLAAWLIEQGRSAEGAPLLSEATIALTPLSAAPALARARELSAAVPVSAG
jgi:hypothetical protein